MKIIIDRIEDNLIIGERDDKEMVKININQINGEYKEGDVITLVEGKFKVDKDETNNLRKEVKNLMSDLFEE